MLERFAQPSDGFANKEYQISQSVNERFILHGDPLHFPFYFLGLLSSTIQALVFTLLATVYIALWLPHGHHAEEHGHH